MVFEYILYRTKSKEYNVGLGAFRQDTNCHRHGLRPEEVAYAGDDLPDIPVLKAAGLSAAPADAVPEVKDVCDYISLFPGGRGFVRDLIEQVLKVHGDWYMDTDVFAERF